MWSDIHIAAKEMVPVVIAVALWGAEWAESTILVRSDNMSVVLALAGGTAKDHLLMHLLRCLHFFTVSHQIGIQSRHVAGVMNVVVDALSHNNRCTFFQCISQASKEPSIVPVQLLEILPHQRPDWSSHNWRRKFHSISGKLWPHQQ